MYKKDEYGYTFYKAIGSTRCLSVRPPKFKDDNSVSVEEMSLYIMQQLGSDECTSIEFHEAYNQAKEYLSNRILFS